MTRTGALVLGAHDWIELSGTDVVGQQVRARRLVGACRRTGRTRLAELPGDVHRVPDDRLRPGNPVHLYRRQRRGRHGLRVRRIASRRWRSVRLSRSRRDRQRGSRGSGNSGRHDPTPHAMTNRHASPRHRRAFPTLSATNLPRCLLLANRRMRRRRRYPNFHTRSRALGNP